MNRAAIAVLLCAFAPLSHAQSRERAIAVQENEAVVTVTKVDKEKRTVTFRGPKGNLATLAVPAQGQNFDQVKPGQRYRMKYVEAIAVELHKGGAPAAAVTEQVNLNPKGAKPGGVMMRTNQVSGVIDAVDYTDRYVAIRGPKGNVVALKVAPDINLQDVSAGDRITVTYTEALAVEMVAQAPAKKAEKKAAEKK
jgi:hypothetical protein